MRKLQTILLKAINIIIFFVLASSISLSSIDMEGEKLIQNQLYSKRISGSQMHTYEITVPAIYNNKDLIVESYLTKENEFIKSPLIILSLDPLTTALNEKQWICNQLGGETCFLPAKYLHSEQKVYLGVYCKNCDYKIRYLFANETPLKLGETTLFHLKAGDSKVFDLNISNSSEFKDYINISSFNLRMTKYDMKVEIINNLDKSKSPITSNVKSNWKGGMQSLIYPKNFILTGDQGNNLMNYSFKIIIFAQDNGVFSLEATSGNTVIPLNNSSLRFDSASEKAPICYSYNNNNSNSLLINFKSLNGDMNVMIKEDKMPQFDDYLRKYSVESEREEKVNLPINPNSKKVYLCVESRKASSYFTIQVFNEGKESIAKNYQSLLFSKFNIYIYL